MKYLVMILLSLAFSNCQNNEEQIEGKFIEKIERNTIIFVDGSIYELDQSDGSKIFYLVRHAEKDTTPTDNPVLTREGYQRSYRLAEIFKSTKLDAVYSTLLNRTIHTVDSLTQLKGISTSIYQPKDLKDLGDKMVKSSSLNRVLISGHSNTTPAFAGVLMGETQYNQSFDESDYDNLLIVQIPKEGERMLLKLRYK